jgi:F420-dependent oxidoreductase-like protein
MTTRLGFQIPNFSFPDVPTAALFDQVASIACRAENAGFDTVFVMDHFYQLPMIGAPDEPMLEAYTLLGALAARTSRVRLATLVTGNTYRNPALLAKVVTTLDVISGGRAVLGIGAGWFEPEHRAYGFDFKTVRGRLEALDESLRILRGLFTQERTTLHGKHYTVDDALALPKPVQKPYPPILIGGTGEKILLRIVAEHADMWNGMGSPERMRQLIDVIARHGEKVGRDTTAIEKTVAMMFCYRSPEREPVMMQIVAGVAQTTPEQARGQIMIGGKQECLDTIERYARAGVTHFIFMLMAPDFLDGLQAFAEEVIPALPGRGRR